MSKPLQKLADILSGCIKGKEESREWIYKNFYGYVKSIVVRYIDNDADAEELINDNFIKVFGKLHTFKLPEDDEMLLKTFKVWLSRISSRTAIDFLRIAKHNKNLDELTDETEMINHVTVIEKINANDILKLLNSLPEMHRVIFNMHEIEGFTHVEISKALNIPEKHSRVYLARAKSRLRILYTKTLSGICYEK